MLNELTKEQTAMMTEVAEEWIRVASEVPYIDEETIRKGMQKLLAMLGLKKQKIIVVSSPSAAQIQSATVSGKKEYCQTDWVGLCSCSWIAFYDFFARIGVKTPPEFVEYRDIIKATLIWDMVVFDDTLIVTRGPKKVYRDDRGRAHREDGPAVVWHDDYGNWFWHGVSVTEKVILGKFTAEEALNEKNTEVQRCMVEKMGPEKFIDKVGAKIIHEDVDGGGMKRRLLSIAVNETEWRIAHVICPSTGREYYLRVPPSVKTGREAVAWTFGVDPESYVTTVEK